MHLIITLISNEQLHLGESWAGLAQRALRNGKIFLENGQTGRLRVIPETSIMDVNQFSDEDWERIQKAAEEAKAKAEDDAKKKAAEEKAAADKAALDAEMARLKTIEDRKLKNQMKRLFGKSAK